MSIFDEDMWKYMMKNRVERKLDCKLVSGKDVYDLEVKSTLNEFQKTFRLKRKFTIEDVNNRMNRILFPKNLSLEPGWKDKKFWFFRTQMMIENDEIWEYIQPIHRFAYNASFAAIIIINNDVAKWIREITEETNDYRNKYHDLSFRERDELYYI